MIRAWRFTIAAASWVGLNPDEAGFQKNVMFLPSQRWGIVSIFEFLGRALHLTGRGP